MATKETVDVPVAQPDVMTSDLEMLGLNADGSEKATAAPEPPKGEEKPAAETPPDEDDDKGKDLSPDEQEKRRHRSAQRRIDKAVKEQRVAEREAAAAKALLEEVRATNERLLKAVEGKKPDGEKADDKPPAAEKPPKYEDFDTLDEFLEARDAWKDAQREKTAPKPKEGAPPEKPAVSPQQQLRNERWLEINEKAKADAAYKKAVFEDLTITTAMADSILDQDNFDEVIDHFVANPAAAKKIAALEAKGQKDKIAGAIAYIAESLVADDDATPPDGGDKEKDIEGDADPIPDTPEADGAPPPRKTPVSAAPTPIRPVRSGGASRPSKNPDEMTQAEYEAWRRKGGGR